MKLSEILPEVRKAAAEYINIWPEVHANQREQIEDMGHRKFAEINRSCSYLENCLAKVLNHSNGQ